MTHRAFPRQQGFNLWLFVIVIIVIAALVASGWWGWQQWRVLEQDRQQRLQQISELRGDFDRQAERQEQALTKLRKTQDRLEAERARDRQALADVRQGGQRLWLINEAESLAALAGQRLMLTGDTTAARRLLKAADETLARLDDPQVLSARKALAVDMEKLSGARQVDVEAMVLRLGALQALVPELAVPEPQAPEAREVAEDAGWWQRLLGYLPVTVRRREVEMPLPLTETQAATARLTLDASLQQAQLALMQSRVEAYHQALSNAATMLDLWFQKDQGRVRQLHVALGELGSQDVDQALPEIGAGLDALRVLKRELLKNSDNGTAGETGR